VGQEHERGAAVLSVRTAFDEAVALEQADHRGHRLLAESRPRRQLAHAQTVLLEEWNEQ